MSPLKYALIAGILAAAIAPKATNASAPSATSHAFDYQVGAWRVHVSRLMNPGSPRPRWGHYDGTHSVMPLLSGRANIGVLEIAGPNGSIEGLQLRLYDPLTQQWNLSFASGGNGEVQPPSIGRFTGGQGEFLSNERIAGRAALVRAQTIVHDPSAYRDVISYSTNHGATWQPLWIASYTKMSNGTTSSAGATTKSQHDFDFQIGEWRVQLARLPDRLNGSHTWRNYSGTLVERRLWNGRANVGVLRVRSGKDCLESILLRTFDPQTNQWRDYGASPADGSIGIPPTQGRFSQGRGELYDHETFKGRPIIVRGVFDEITVRSNRFVQSFSADDGKSWEPNLIVHFTRES